MTMWKYLKSGLLKNEEVGPISDSDLLTLAYSGSIDLSTEIFHPTHTKGQWVSLSRIPAAKKKFEAGEIQRREKEQAERLARQQQEEVERLARQAERDQRHAEKEAQRQVAAAERSASLKSIANFLKDGQSPEIIEKVFQRVSQLMTSQESIEYMAVCLHMPGFSSPDCAVVTNRRFMIVHQKILGRMTFDDHQWIDLQDAKLKEGVMSSEISFRTSQGGFLSLDFLPKSQARRIYTICQEREEHARQRRHELMLEEKRAAAGGGIVVNAGYSPSPQSAPATTPADDPVEKLTKLKRMLDAGLIEQSEYDATKKRILEAM